MPSLPSFFKKRSNSSQADGNSQAQGGVGKTQSTSSTSSSPHRGAPQQRLSTGGGARRHHLLGFTEEHPSTTGAGTLVISDGEASKKKAAFRKKQQSSIEEFFNGAHMDLDEAEDKKAIISAVDEAMQSLEFQGALPLEKDSVYGAIVALPQIARCMEWNTTLCLLCFRAAVMLVLNYFLQTFSIILVGESSQVMDVLAGKMHLCDFGRTLDGCPDGPGCIGPSGTRMTPPRLYSFDIWSTRIYVRDAIIAMFPDQKDEIMEKVDPGEYGMENYYGRFLACFIFMLVEVRDLLKIYALCQLLWELPNGKGQWVSVEKKEDDEDEGPASPAPCASPHLVLEEENHSHDDDDVKFRVCGMPIVWKILVLIFVVFPKLWLWQSVVWIGVRWLMETSGILSGILGAITMDFILTFDELIYDSLGNDATKYVMERIEDFTPSRTSKSAQAVRYALLGIPRRLLLTFLFFACYVFAYYRTNCQEGADGSWVSTPMELPKSCTYHFYEFLTGIVPHEDKPYWTMPDETGS